MFNNFEFTLGNILQPTSREWINDGFKIFDSFDSIIWYFKKKCIHIPMV